VGAFDRNHLDGVTASVSEVFLPPRKIFENFISIKVLHNYISGLVWRRPARVEARPLFDDQTGHGLTDNWALQAEFRDRIERSVADDPAGSRDPQCHRDRGPHFRNRSIDASGAWREPDAVAWRSGTRRDRRASWRHPRLDSTSMRGFSQKTEVGAASRHFIGAPSAKMEAEDLMKGLGCSPVSAQ
jgi:hypothetical protein